MSEPQPTERLTRALANKVVLMTGGTHGIGLVVARQLAALGAKLYLVAPDRTDAEKAVAREVAANITHASGAQVCLFFGDLSSQAEVRRIAREFINTGDPLHILINNAGVLGTQHRQVTKDGLELLFGLNYLAQFTLTNTLLPKLIQSSPARVINVASGVSEDMKFDLENYNAERDYHFLKQYAFSKLCIIVFTRELAKRLQGTGVTANCLHPGLVYTGIARSAGLLYSLGLRWRARKYAQSTEKAAETYLYLAAAPEMKDVSGSYFHNKQEVPLTPAALSDDNASKLWALSQRLTGDEKTPRLGSDAGVGTY